MERKDTAPIDKTRALLSRLWLLSIVAYGGFCVLHLPSFYKQTQGEYYRSKNESIHREMDSLYLQKHGVRHEEWAKLKTQQESAQCVQDYKDRHSFKIEETDNLIENATAHLKQEEVYWQATRFCNKRNYQAFDPELGISQSERKSISTKSFLFTWLGALSEGFVIQIAKLALFIGTSFLILIFLPLWLFYGKATHPKDLLQDLCVSLRALRFNKNP